MILKYKSYSARFFIVTGATWHALHHTMVTWKIMLSTHRLVQYSAESFGDLIVGHDMDLVIPLSSRGGTISAWLSESCSIRVVHRDIGRWYEESWYLEIILYAHGSISASEDTAVDRPVLARPELIPDVAPRESDDPEWWLRGEFSRSELWIELATEQGDGEISRV